MKWGPPLRMVALASGGLLAVAFIGVLAWFFITQRPSPEARHFEALHRDRVPPPEADNAFFDVHVVGHGGRVPVGNEPVSEREISDEITERIFGGILSKVAPPRMLNSHARLLARLCVAFEVPLDRYLQARDVFIEESGSDQADSYAMYALRVGSIEGMRRAALLVAELRSRGVVADDVRAQLGQAELRRPFDGEPFTWNAAEQAVQHEGPEKKRRANALHY